MKNYQTQSRYQIFNRKRSEKAESLKRESNRKKLNKKKLKIGVSKKKFSNEGFQALRSEYGFTNIIPSFKEFYHEYDFIYAPEHFSLTDNSEEFIFFTNQLKNCFDYGIKVYVVLRAVKKIDYSAIAVLFSIMIRFKALQIPFAGDVPDDQNCLQKLRSSGFFTNLYQRFEDEPSYRITKRNFITHASREVVSPVTADILFEAAKTIWGTPRRCNGVQNSLIELMQNTVNHASEEDEGKHWWLSVNHLERENKVIFSFVDYGVGILNSLSSAGPNNKWFGSVEKMIERFHYKDNAEFLELILKGELHKTITDEYYRGQGLPGLRNSMEDNWFCKLKIISNDVYANVSEDKYSVLDNKFTGTFAQWEINIDNKSLPL